MESLDVWSALFIMAIIFVLAFISKLLNYKSNIKRHTYKPIALFPVLAKVITQEGGSAKVTYEIAKIDKSNQWVAVSDGRYLKGVHSWVYIKDIFKSD